MTGSTIKVKDEDESCQAVGGSSKEEGKSMHFDHCQGMRRIKVPVTPFNVTATATTTGASPQIHFYDSNSMDSLIVINYRSKLQERVNNANVGASYLCANSLPTINIKEDSNRRQPPPANSSINKDKDSNRVLPYHHYHLLLSSKDKDNAVMEFQKEDIPPNPNTNY
eukprot:8589139-Ditylum_brightwellii.AAC.1